MSLGESGENYLEAILILGRDRRFVRSVDVASFLAVSKPSVSRAMAILRSEGYVESDETGLSLTERGAAVAGKMFERHELLSEFLTSIGVSRSDAARDACRIEHVISEESFNKLKEHAHKTMTSL